MSDEFKELCRLIKDPVVIMFVIMCAFGWAIRSEGRDDLQDEKLIAIEIKETEFFTRIMMKLETLKESQDEIKQAIKAK